MADYATIADVGSYWRTLTDAEGRRASTLIGFASAMVRAHCHGEPSDAEAARFVVCDMVKNAMLADATAAPVTSMSMAGGPYSRTVQYANPTGDLYWKAQYDQMLGTKGVSAACIRARTAYDG